MDTKLKELLERYEGIKTTIIEANVVLGELQPQILELMPVDAEIPTYKGKFLIQQRTVWRYSKGLRDQKAGLKKMEQMEVADGTAQGTTSSILYYYPNKEEE